MHPAAETRRPRANKRPRGGLAGLAGLAGLPAHLLADIYDRLHVRDRRALSASGRAKDDAWRAEVATRRGRDARLAAWHFAVRRGFMDPAAPPSHLLAFLRSNRADPTVVEALGPAPVGGADNGDAVSDPEEQLVARIRESTLTADYLSSTGFQRAMERIETDSNAAFSVIWELSRTTPPVYDLVMEHPRFIALVSSQYYSKSIVRWVLAAEKTALIDHVLVGKRNEQYVIDGVQEVRDNPDENARMMKSPLAVSACLRLCDPPQEVRDAMLKAASAQLNVEVMRILATSL